MDVAARFVPGAEAALGDAVADAFRRAAQPGIFPIVDRAGAVGGQVREPALGDQGIDDSCRPVFHEVRAVDQHHRGAALAGCANLGRQIVERGRQARVQRARRGGRIDEDLLHAREALALGQRIDADLTEIQRRARPGHGVLPPRWIRSVHAFTRTVRHCALGSALLHVRVRQRHSRASASRKSGITTSAPTPRSRCRFQGSMRRSRCSPRRWPRRRPARPRALVFSIST